MTMSQQNTSLQPARQTGVPHYPHWNYFCFSQEHPWFNFCQWPFCYLSVQQHVGRLAASCFWSESLHRFPGHHRHLLSSSVTGCASLSFCSSSSSSSSSSKTPPALSLVPCSFLSSLSLGDLIHSFKDKAHTTLKFAPLPLGARNTSQI